MEEIIRIVIEAVQRSAGELEKVQKQITALNQSNKSSESIFTRTRKAIAANEVALRNMGFAALAAAGSMALLLRNSLKTADAFNKQANSLGTTTEKLSALAFAAGQADIEQGQLAQSLNFLQRALAESVDSGSNAAQIFRQLGVATKDAAGNLRDPIDVLHDLADAFATSSGAAVKAQFSQELFGRGSKDFIAFLNQGSAALREQELEAKQLGAVFSNETGRQADVLSDTIDKLKEAFKGVSNQALAILLPELIKLAELFIAVAKDGNTVSTGALLIVTAFRTLAQIVIPLVQLFRALGVIIGQGLALAFELAIIEVQTFIKLLLTLGRNVGLVINAVVELVKTIGSLGGVIGKAIKGDFSGAATAAKESLSSIGTQAGKVVDSFKGVFDGTGAIIEDATTKAAGAIVSIGEGAFKELANLADETKRLFDIVSGDAVAATETATARTNAQTRQLKPLTPKGAMAGEDKSFQAGVDQFISGLSGLENRAQLASRVLSGTLGNAIQGVSDGITGLITGTTTWGQVFQQVGLQVISSLVQIGVEMLVQFILRQTIGSALQASAAAEGASIAASYAPAAATAGAATFGVGTVIGVALTVAAIVAALAALAFAEGGLVPGAPSSTDNRIAAVATGEYIMPASVVSQYGAGFFEAIRRGQTPFMGYARGGLVARPVRGNSFQEGGLVGAALVDEAENLDAIRTNFAIVNTRQQMREFQKKEGTRIVADALGKRSNQVVS